jgi:hypothetical protein
MFDLTINLGMILQTLAIVAGGIFFLWEMKLQLNLLKQNQNQIDIKLEAISLKVNELGQAAIQIARQDERLNAQDLRIQELSNRVATCYAPHTPKKRLRT